MSDPTRNGYRRLLFVPHEVWASVSDPTRIVVLGAPSAVEDETHPDYHNCDAMGCGSVGPHVVMRATVRTS